MLHSVMLYHTTLYYIILGVALVDRLQPARDGRVEAPIYILAYTYMYVYLSLSLSMCIYIYT